MPKQKEHNKLIMSQFTRQAIPFSKKVPAHSNKAAFKLIMDTMKISKKDTVLDVACGPGMLTAVIAQAAHKVTGIDLVPAMIKQARVLQKEQGLSNMEWQTGDVSKLPYKDNSFTTAVTRFSFHHFLKPQAVLKEMARVAKNKVAVIDVYSKSPAHARLHDHMEKLRDDSHVKILSLAELQNLAAKAGLTGIKARFYNLEIELEQQLSASFPKAGNADKIRQLVQNDKEGLISYKKGSQAYLVYPVVIIAGQKQQE